MHTGEKNHLLSSGRQPHKGKGYTADAGPTNPKNVPSAKAVELYGIMIDDNFQLDDYYRVRAGKGQVKEKKFEWSDIPKQLINAIPIVAWLPKYSWGTDFPMDLVAGIAVASMLVPQSLALALLAGLPPVIGLYASMITPFTYACLGESRQISVGPEAVTSILLALLLKSIAPEDPIAFAHLLAFTVGVLLFLLGFFRFGFLDNILSQPLLAGFINAVAITVFLEQIGPFFGLAHFSIFEDWNNLGGIIGEMDEKNLLTAIIGVITCTILFSFKFLNRWITNSGTENRVLKSLKLIPATLVAVLFGVSVCYFGQLEDKGVKIVGTVPSDFPFPRFPDFSSFEGIRETVTPAAILAVLGFIESIIVAKHYALKYNYQINPNQELLALGVGNIVGSFFQIYPTFGSLMRSAVADSYGAKTQFYQFIVSLLVLMAILFMGPLFYYLPKVVLASIIIVAATGLLEVDDVFFLWKVQAYKNVVLLFITFFLTILFGVEEGILISLGISILLIIRHTSLPHIAILGRLPGTTKYKDIAQYPEAETLPGIIIMRIEEALYFANVGHVKEMLERMERYGRMESSLHDDKSPPPPPVKGFIIDARNIADIDSNAVHILHTVKEEYHKRHIRFCFVKLRSNIKPILLRSGLIESTEGDTIFSTTQEAVDWLERGSLAHSSYSNLPTDDDSRVEKQFNGEDV